MKADFLLINKRITLSLIYLEASLAWIYLFVVITYIN